MFRLYLSIIALPSGTYLDFRRTSLIIVQFIIFLFTVNLKENYFRLFVKKFAFTQK